MRAISGIGAFGTQLKRGDGATPEVFTALANVTSIDPPSFAREALDVTAHDSPDKHREFVGGAVDPGEVSVDINYDPADHDSLIVDLVDDDPRNYQIVFPTSPVATWAFAAVMTGFSAKAPFEGKLAATLKFKVSGKPTIT